MFVNVFWVTYQKKIFSNNCVSLFSGRQKHYTKFPRHYKVLLITDYNTKLIVALLSGDNVDKIFRQDKVLF